MCNAQQNDLSSFLTPIVNRKICLTCLFSECVYGNVLSFNSQDLAVVSAAASAFLRFCECARQREKDIDEY